MPRQNEKLRIHLKPKVRRELEALCRQGCVSAAKVRRVRILCLPMKTSRAKYCRIAKLRSVSACVSVRWCEFANSLRGKEACRLWNGRSDRVLARHPSSMAAARRGWWLYVAASLQKAVALDHSLTGG